MSNLHSFVSMNKERYDLMGSPNGMEFQFVSEGPNGRIKKIIVYTPRGDQNLMFFNLGFGDLEEDTGNLNDFSKSNNGDREKILATVARTVLEFTTYFPTAVVYAEGSTPARTRLYQMGLTANINEIEQVLEVFGLIENNWYRFKPNVNYRAFVVYRK